MKSNSTTISHFALAFGLAAIVALAFWVKPAGAAEKAATPSGKQPAPEPEAPKGLLPIPDYSGDLWTRSYLTGDWGGTRTDWANKGIQFGLNWNQYLQGVTDGGLDRTTQY